MSCFFKRLVDKENDKVKFVIIPKTNEEYISMNFEFIRFLDSYLFLSSSLDSLVKILSANSHKTLKTWKKIVESDEMLNIVDGVVEEDRTDKDLKKDYPDEIIELEGALINYMRENDLKIWNRFSW